MEADKTQKLLKEKLKEKGLKVLTRDCLFCPYLKRTVGVI